MQYTCNAALHVYYCSYYEEPQLLPQEDGVDKTEHIVSAGQGNRVGLNGSDAGALYGSLYAVPESMGVGRLPELQNWSRADFDTTTRFRRM